MFNKKVIFFIVSLIVALIAVQVLIYKISVWYEQALGNVFTYIILIIFTIFILSPFKFIKDKRKSINFANYIKYMGLTLIVISKFILNVLKEIVTTLMYVVTPFLFKNKKEVGAKSSESDL